MLTFPFRRTGKVMETKHRHITTLFKNFAVASILRIPKVQYMSNMAFHGRQALTFHTVHSIPQATNASSTALRMHSAKITLRRNWNASSISFLANLR